MDNLAQYPPVEELLAWLPSTALRHVDKVIAIYPFEFLPSALFDTRWQRSPYLGRYLVSNFKKGWFVYLYWGVNMAVFVLWQCPSLLDIPSKLFSSSSSRTKQQRRERGLPRNVRTLRDLRREEKQGRDVLWQPEARPLRRHFTLSLDNIAQGRWWTVLTSAVSHVDLDHVFKNMVAFVGAASIAINTGVSNGKVFSVCLGAAIAGSLGQLWHYEHKAKRDRQKHQLGVIRTTLSLGASGAVSGLSIAMAVLFPHAKTKSSLGFLPVPLTIPLWAIPFGSMAYDVWKLGDESSRIAHAVHIGGAIFGGLYSFVAWKGLTFTPLGGTVKL